MTGEVQHRWLARRELVELVTCGRTRSIHDRIRAWLAAAHAAGWPPHPLGIPTDYDAFVRRLEREMLAVHRAGDNPYSRAWRVRLPEWRADMTPEAYDRWELARYREQRNACIACDRS